MIPDTNLILWSFLLNPLRVAMRNFLLIFDFRVLLINDRKVLINPIDYNNLLSISRIHCAVHKYGNATNYDAFIIVLQQCIKHIRRGDCIAFSKRSMIHLAGIVIGSLWHKSKRATLSMHENLRISHFISVLYRKLVQFGKKTVH